MNKICEDVLINAHTDTCSFTGIDIDPEGFVYASNMHAVKAKATARAVAFGLYPAICSM